MRATRQHLFSSPPNLIERVAPTGEMIRQVYRSASLHAIRQYIAENPLRWTDDPENPEYPVPDQHPLADFPF
jgi:hypothetical protein